MKWIVTGAAGFIGANTLFALSARGIEAIGIDNMSRAGAVFNAGRIGNLPSVRLHRADVRDFDALGEIFRSNRDADVVLHLAGQVAVTTSVDDPRFDFENNALGTFNVCEAVRAFCPDALLINASTNKVYGHLEDMDIVEQQTRYVFRDHPRGVGEERPIDFVSPYGCSKGAAEQYVLDYARIYGLSTVSARQSCIYGPWQFGIEDQGWLAWFSICALLDIPLTIFGDGKQVRDVLFVDDLVSFYLAAAENRERVSGQAFNIGGGAGNSISLCEAVGVIDSSMGSSISLNFEDPRPGDQRVFISDTSKAERLTGWKPAVDYGTGIPKLCEWLRANGDHLRELHCAA